MVVVVVVLGDHQNSVRVDHSLQSCRYDLLEAVHVLFGVQAVEVEGAEEFDDGYLTQTDYV